MNYPRCFISYAHESNEHKDWVRELATRLQKMGIYVILDQWDLRFGHDLLNYMEDSIRDSDFVLLICTPTFASKANKREGGVGFEKTIVNREIFQKISAPEKFVPILRAGDDKSSIPTYLIGKLYADFRGDGNFEENLTELYNHILGINEHERPINQLQIYPSIKNNVTKHNHASSKTAIIRDLISFASGGLFGSSIFGLGMSQSEAADFAIRIYKLIPSERIGDFKKLVSFAKVQIVTGNFLNSNLNMTISDAIEFAIRTIKEIPHEEIDEFMNLITYARQMKPFGLGMSNSEAIDYAMEIIKRI